MGSILIGKRILLILDEIDQIDVRRPSHAKRLTGGLNEAAGVDAAVRELRRSRRVTPSQVDQAVCSCVAKSLGGRVHPSGVHVEREFRQRDSRARQLLGKRKPLTKHVFARLSPVGRECRPTWSDARSEVIVWGQEVRLSKLERQIAVPPACGLSWVIAELFRLDREVFVAEMPDLLCGDPVRIAFVRIGNGQTDRICTSIDDGWPELARSDLTPYDGLESRILLSVA